MPAERFLENWPRSFRELYCQTYGCRREGFEKRVFWRSVHRESWLISSLIYFFYPVYFSTDFAVIQKLGNTTSPADFDREVIAYQRMTDLEVGTWRVRWRLRISGRLLIQIKNEVSSRGFDGFSPRYSS